jgi:hypothetical protein
MAVIASVIVPAWEAFLVVLLALRVVGEFGLL